MTLLVVALGLHCLADFVLQSWRMSKFKSTSIGWLSVHVLIYTLTTTSGIGLFCAASDAPFPLVAFWLLTFALHWATDFVTSRITSRAWALTEALRPGPAPPDNKDGRLVRWRLKHIAHGRAVHNFFVVVGVDQFLHVLALAWTIGYLGLARW